MTIRKTTLAFFALLSLTGAAFAQTSAPQRTISVTGTATINLPPDFAQVEVGAFAKNGSAVKAKKECDAKMAKAIAAIKKLGVKAEDIGTTGYNIFPTREKEESPIIWKVQQSISVKIRNLNIVADVLDASVMNGATNVSSINFGLNEFGTGRSKVRGDAVKVAKEKAATLASLFGVELGEVQTVVEQQDFAWRAQWATNSYAGDAGAPGGASIAPGQQAVSLTVNVVFAIK